MKHAQGSIAEVTDCCLRKPSVLNLIGQLASHLRELDWPRGQTPDRQVTRDKCIGKGLYRAYYSDDFTIQIGVFTSSDVAESHSNLTKHKSQCSRDRQYNR